MLLENKFKKMILKFQTFQNFEKFNRNNNNEIIKL